MGHLALGTPRRRIAVAALLIGALLVQHRVLSQARPAQDSAAHRGRRVVLVGVDAADWLAIDPLVESGALPTFARLKAQGRTGLLVATPPLVSPIVWTTIATGVEPENHGILDFMRDLPGGGQEPIGSSQRLSPALWNLFSDDGRRVAVVGWWATWPAEDVRGTIVSDALAPQLTRDSRQIDARLVSPESAAARVTSQVVRSSSLTRDDLARYVPVTQDEYERAARARTQAAGRFYQDPVAHLAAVIASTRTYAAIAESLVRDERPDLLAVYFEVVDTVSHLFAADPRKAPRAIEAAYREVDQAIGRLARASTPDTLVIVCSDHGFYPSTAGITEDPSDLLGPATAWHRPYGVVGVATAGALTARDDDGALHGPGDLGRVTPLDIAPTILHVAGLPVSSEMPGRVIRPMLPSDQAARPELRALPAKFTPPSPATGRHDEADALARLQALGYIGAVKTSLARLNLAESFFRRRKLPQAERELRAVLSTQPANLSARLWLAQVLERQGRTDEALTAYAQAVALRGGARLALVTAVDLAVRENRTADARRLVDAAGPARDAAAPLHVALGAIADRKRDRPAAEREYRAALGDDPLSFEAAARLLDVLLEDGRPRDGLAAVERAVAGAPDSPRHVALLGEARLAMRDGIRAEAAFRRALQLAPDGEQAQLGLARALILQKKWTEAVSVLVTLPPSADRDVLLGAAYSSTRDWTRAAERLQAALDGGRVTPDVLNGLGWAQLQLGRRAEAAALLARSLDANPNQPEIRRLLADIGGRKPGGSP